MYLPSSLNGVEIVAEGAGDDPDLRQAELRWVIYPGWPHVNTRSGPIVFLWIHVPNRVLPPKQSYVKSSRLQGKKQ